MDLQGNKDLQAAPDGCRIDDGTVAGDDTGVFRLGRAGHLPHRHGFRDAGRALRPGRRLAGLAQALPDAVALAATLGLHLWRRSAVPSILAGTAVHVALATAFAAH